MDDLFFVLNGITGGYIVTSQDGKTSSFVLQESIKSQFSSPELFILEKLVKIGQSYASIRRFVDAYKMPNFSNPSQTLNGRFLSAFCHGTDSTLLEGYRNVYLNF